MIWYPLNVNPAIVATEVLKKQHPEHLLTRETLYIKPSLKATTRYSYKFLPQGKIGYLT